MDKLRSTPYFLNDSYLGCIQGLSYFPASSTLGSTPTTPPLCHYFGGIPYALPSIGPFRWKRPRPLPPCYRYGTTANPGVFTGGASVCPQPKYDPFGKGCGYSGFLEGEEDCLQLNIWKPAGEEPKEGWPVVFYIHGGFLQFGTPNSINPAALLSETDVKCIFVLPAYRLNVFGFLVAAEFAEGGDSAPNLGFWDQRMALEWTRKHCSAFGGNSQNITVAGFSAGAHSVFYQLAYDLFLPSEKSIIQRVIMWSNGPGLKPKSFQDGQKQFDELLDHLGIASRLSHPEKMRKLRSIPPLALLHATENMKYHQFRATTDDHFIRQRLFQDINDGTFARRMKDRSVRLLIGECSDEHWMYSLWHPPIRNTLSSLTERLEADYATWAVSALKKHYYPDKSLPSGIQTWNEAFGKVYADLQIHMLQRGLLQKLLDHGAEGLLYRYRIEWRAKAQDALHPKEYGVTHSTDQSIWWFGNGRELEENEKSLVQRAFLMPLAKFFKGEREIGWGTARDRDIRRLKADGSVDIIQDANWDNGVEIWQLLHEDEMGDRPVKAKL
jgi:carboxylesterase type B